MHGLRTNGFRSKKNLLRQQDFHPQNFSPIVVDLQFLMARIEKKKKKIMCKHIKQKRNSFIEMKMQFSSKLVSKHESLSMRQNVIILLSL